MEARMKITRLILPFALLVILTSPALAAPDVKLLMNQQGCFSCHAVDQKMVGPSFKQVAARYRGKKGSLSMLAKKIISGGNGHWNDLTGGMMMPPHPDLKPSDAKAIAQWVLSLK